MGAVLVKRRLDDFRFHDLPADVDPELTPRLRVRRWQIARADRNVERRAQRPTAHDAARRAIADDGIPVARKRAFARREPHELPLNALRLLPDERGLSD